ncbi:hypothetical protein CALCODRAFT_505321 [Calocera cornea HHB12733]|uniref:Uncharacterized protein n=1 Tax=Calocera cornea HHB12733 TaxID=1353952 RepID=A0A165KBW1_9BASI|nr:hypothetical protein CALCODRAFT_505321 [Calocera cornea HHB12733]
MASISEPFLLHSYAVPPAAGPSSCKGLPHVQAEARWGDAAEITMTVQGDGIHTLDRSSLHPVSSYTLGPSTFFRSAASSRAGKAGKHSTYVSVAAGSDITESGKTAWIWPEGSEDTASKKSVELAHPAQEFLFVPALPSQVIVASPDGHLTLSSTNLEPIHDLPPPFTITGRAKNFIFPKLAHTVGTNPGSTHQAVLISFFGNEEGKFGARVVRVSEGELDEVGWVQLDDIKGVDVVGVSCEAAGNASVLPSVPEKFAVFLSPATSSQALITLTCPLGAKKSDSKPRSSVFIVPFSVPQTSSLINALGRLQVSEPQAIEGDTGLSDGQRRLVKSVGDALRSGASESAEKTFFDWVSLESKATSNGVHTGAEQGDGSEEEDVASANGLVNEDSDEEATLTNGREVNGASRPKLNEAPLRKKALVHLPIALVEQLVDVLLVPPQPATEAHSAILRFLMRRGLVSYSMVKGDQKLLDVLLERGDWASVVVALQSVVDMPESAIVRVLMVGLKGTGAGTPLPLPNVLAAVLAAPITRSALRLALKEQLTDITNVRRLLEVLQGWLVQSGVRGLELAAEDTGFVQVDFRPKPRIDSILAFAETLIDTYFIALLQHPPARAVLQELSALLAPQLTLAADLERLRGPLEVFAKQKRLQKQSGLPKAAVSRFEEGRRRKRAQEEAELQVGPYRVEEFFF